MPFGANFTICPTLSESVLPPFGWEMPRRFVVLGRTRSSVSIPESGMSLPGAHELCTHLGQNKKKSQYKKFMEGAATHQLPQTELTARDVREGINEHYPSREFESFASGAAWEVSKYTHPYSTAEQSRYLVKRLTRYPLVKEFSLDELDENDRIKPPRNKETVIRAAERLRQEQDYLHRMYDAELPGLIPRQKIMTVAPRYEGQVGEVIAVQEWVRGYKRLDQIIPYLRSRYEGEDLEVKLEKLREQVESFVSITKYLYTREDENPDFSHAIPDISHLHNLVVDVQDGRVELKLVDTNFVLPVDSKEFAGYAFGMKARYWIVYMEHHFLGKPLKEIEKDPFHADDPDNIAKRVRKYLPEVSKGKIKKILYMLRIINAQQAGVEEVSNPFLEQIERIYQNLVAFVREEGTRKQDVKAGSEKPIKKSADAAPIPKTVPLPKKEAA